jgi:hypothetical protein
MPLLARVCFLEVPHRGIVRVRTRFLRQQAPKHEDSLCEIVFQCFDRDIQDKKERRKQRLWEASEFSQDDAIREQLEGQQLPELVPMDR